MQLLFENGLAANGLMVLKYRGTILELASLIYSIREGHERLYELFSSLRIL